MNTFTVNGYRWRVEFVPHGSPELTDRSFQSRLATTDPKTMTVYLSDVLSGTMLTRVLIHEMCHAVLWSYDLMEEIHRWAKRRYWVEAEEWICNLMADYGMIVFDRASRILGRKALYCVPEALEAIVA